MFARTCILCPGQGAQVVGMGKDFYDSSTAAREVFCEANKVLGFDLAAICFEGPEDKLNQTDICQPAIFTTTVASFRAACQSGAIDPLGIKAYAGLSLGEYTALHLAKVFSFEAGLKLVAARGRYMQQAADANPSGMVAIMGADEAAVTELCAATANGQVLSPANFNAPGQIVCSGHNEACERLAKAAEAKGFKTVMLKVAGAFHSALMASAAEMMKGELAKVQFSAPRATVYANVTAQPHGDADSMRNLLVQQVVSPVRWAQTMQGILADGEWRFIELAPGRTLTGMLRKINRRTPVDNFATAESLAGAKA
jgi:[acyl-carrier-protein] S-malonyltransferase